jgi:hypothetical protein
MTSTTALIVLLLSGSRTDSAPAQFPGERTAVASPNDDWEVQWVPGDQTRGGEHELQLARRRGGGARRLQSFERHVSVAWAPDSRRLAVVDHAGSDTAVSRVYAVTGGRPLDVRAAIEEQQPDALAFTRGAHHLYVEADTWLDESTLSVRVWGYGGPEAFDRRIKLRLAP